MKITIKALGYVSAIAAIGTLALTANAVHTWSTYHWARQANPIPLEVIDSVTSDWQSELNISISEWNQSGAREMNVSQGSEANKARKRCKAVSGKIKVCNASYGRNGWLGLASIYLDANRHITQGTAKLNDSYGSYWADPNEKRHVMCQEVGHLFGLGHTSEDGSSQSTCMDYSSSPSSLSPNGHDYDLLAGIYGHTDAYDSYATGGGGEDPRPCRGGPKKCGSSFAGTLPPGATRVRKNKFAEIWESPRPNGGLIVYHIRLAPGHKFDPGH